MDRNRPGLTLQLIRPSELKLPPVEWLIDGLLPAGMVTLLTSTDKEGKTLLAWEMARAVVKGRPLFGTVPAKQGPALFLAFDDPPQLTAERIRTLGLQDADGLRIATPLQTNLLYPHIILRELRSAVEETGASLVVIDSLDLLMMHQMGSPHDVRRIRKFMRSIGAIAEETGAAILLVAQDRRPGDGFAGSHAVLACAQHVLRLARPRGRTHNGEDFSRLELHVRSNLLPRTIHHVRLNGVGQWERLGGEDDCGEREWDGRVQAALEARPEGAGSQTLAKDLKRRHAEVLAALNRLVLAGRVVKQTLVQEGSGGRPVVYLPVAAETFNDEHESRGRYTGSSPPERSRGRPADSRRSGRPPGEPSPVTGIEDESGRRDSEY